MVTKIETTKAPKAAGSYSQVIIAGNLIFTSGQVHLTLKGKLLEGTIEEQTHQVMKNLQAILESAGVTFQDVVKTTIFVTDMSVYSKINEVYGRYMSEPYPAREIVCVKELPLAAAEGKRFYDEMLVNGDLYWEQWLERVDQTREKLGYYT